MSNEAQYTGHDSFWQNKEVIVESVSKKHALIRDPKSNDSEWVAKKSINLKSNTTKNHEQNYPHKNTQT